MSPTPAFWPSAGSVRLCLSEPRTPETSLREDIRIASEAGFAALDLWAPKLDECLATYPLVWLDVEMQKHHVYATSVSGIEPLSRNGLEARLVREARFLELCTHLDALGGGIVVVQPEAGLSSEEDGARALSWAVHTLRNYASLAAPFEVRVAFEYRAGADGIVRTLAASQEIVDRVDRRNVGLALSIDHLREGGGASEDIEPLEVKRLWLVRLETLPSEARGEGRHSDGEKKSNALTQRYAVLERLALGGFRGPYCVRGATDLPNATTDSLIDRARRARLAALNLLAPLYP